MSANMKKCAVSHQGILSEAFVEERRPTIVVKRHWHRRVDDRWRKNWTKITQVSCMLLWYCSLAQCLIFICQLFMYILTIMLLGNVASRAVIGWQLPPSYSIHITGVCGRDGIGRNSCVFQMQLPTTICPVYYQCQAGTERSNVVACMLLYPQL